MFDVKLFVLGIIFPDASQGVDPLCAVLHSWECLRPVQVSLVDGVTVLMWCYEINNCTFKI